MNPHPVQNHGEATGDGDDGSTYPALGSPWPDQRGPAIRARMDAKEPPTNVGAWLGFRLYFPVAACFT
jgi:hypothetical protein